MNDYSNTFQRAQSNAHGSMVLPQEALRPLKAQLNSKGSVKRVQSDGIALRRLRSRLESSTKRVQSDGIASKCYAFVEYRQERSKYSPPVPRLCCVYLLTSITLTIASFLILPIENFLTMTCRVEKFCVQTFLDHPVCFLMPSRCPGRNRYNVPL